MADTTRFLESIRKIETKELDLIGLISAAEGLVTTGESDLAVVLYKFWLMANPDHPLKFGAAFNCGFHLLKAGNLPGAKEFFGQAIAANPDYHPARLSLAAACEGAGDIDGAVREWQQIIDRLSTVSSANISNKVQALKNIARVRRNTDVAEAALKQSLEIAPHQDDLVQHWASQRQGKCVWPVLEPVGNFTVQDVLRRLAPLTMAMYTDDPLLQFYAAGRYSKQMAFEGAGINTAGDWLPPTDPVRKKLRIAYLTSDFCHHAIGYLMSGVLENHDRNRFEILIFNIGERNNDPMQLKYISQCDRWTDIRGVDDRVAAAMILDQGTDILIDMNGHTNYQRTRLLALKPAPIIANWLGYPGTMGSDHHHYIIADDFIIPPELEQYCSEKVARLPCYQANHRLYQVPAVRESRVELGLPATGTVFCCFNGAVKITEPMFTRWMQILTSVPGSVLWLRGSPEDASSVRLRNEAARRGVAPERLVFLSFRSNTEYLGCHRYADLFLDTFPYSAHTTGSDALRMGVPVLTLVGRGFASRVCGSLSHAAGFPDLVVETPEQYVRLAIELGKDPLKIASMKRKLESALPACTLFNPTLLTKSLEQRFEEMWTAYCAGRNPRPKPGLGFC